MFKQEPKIPKMGYFYTYYKNYQACIKSNGDVVIIEEKSMKCQVIKPPKPVVDLAFNYLCTDNDSLHPCIFEDGTMGELRYDAGTESWSIVAAEDMRLKIVSDAKSFCEYVLTDGYFFTFLYISKSNNLVAISGLTSSRASIADVSKAYVCGPSPYNGSCIQGDFDIDVNRGHSLLGFYLTLDGEAKPFAAIVSDKRKSGTITYSSQIYNDDNNRKILMDLYDLNAYGSEQLSFLTNRKGIETISFFAQNVGSPTYNLSAIIKYKNGKMVCRHCATNKQTIKQTSFTLQINPAGYPSQEFTLCEAHAKWGVVLSPYQSEGIKVDKLTVACEEDGTIHYFPYQNGDTTPRASTATNEGYFAGMNLNSSGKDIVEVVPAGDNASSIGNAAFYTLCRTSDGAVVPFEKVLDSASDTDKKNYIKFCDALSHLYTDYTGLVKAKTPISVPQDVTVTGVSVSGEEPENTKRRVLFRLGDVWNRLSIADGVASLAACTKAVTTKVTGTDGTETEPTSNVPLGDDEVNAKYVLENGNTAAELETVKSVPEFVGKDVSVGVALYASEEAVKMPSFALGINTKATKDTYVSTQETQEYALDGDKIVKVEYTPIAKDGGSIEIYASIRTGEAWSKELSLEELKGLSGDAIKFKVRLSATTIGVSQAGIAKLALTLRSPERLATATGSTSLTSKTQAFDIGMLYGRLYVKHAELRDAKISADIMFRETPKKREMYKIAEGTGKQQTVTLADTQVDFSTLQLFANNDHIPVFGFNSMENTVTFTAPELSTVFVTYEYEVEPENWQPMQPQGTQGYTNTAGYASTSFAYQVTGTEKGYSAVRVNLEKPEGSVQDALLGIGTGRMQTFFLPHYAKVETLKLKNGTEEIARKNWSYDQESRMLRLIALKDREVTASYEYVAESPKVYGFVAAWNQ